MNGLHVNEARLGWAHVGSQDQANANMSIIGPGVWLDPVYGSKCAMEMTSANTLQISSGCFWADGHYATIDPAVVVDIANGQAGMKRNDLVCIHCAIENFGTEDQIENFDIVVLQGVSTSGTPSDPTLTVDGITNKVPESWQAIARVRLDGLTPIVESLLHLIPPITAQIPGSRIEPHTIGQEQLATSVWDSISQEECFAGRSTTNLLQISLNNPDASINKPCKISTDNAAELENRADGMPTSGSFIAYRRVYWFAPTHVLVVVLEAFPIPGRIWANFYNTRSWDGWQER